MQQARAREAPRARCDERRWLTWTRSLPSRLSVAAGVASPVPGVACSLETGRPVYMAFFVHACQSGNQSRAQGLFRSGLPGTSSRAGSRREQAVERRTETAKLG